MATTQQNREVEIITPLGPDILLLRNMTVTEELGRMFTMELELVSTSENLIFEDLLAQNITIRLDLPKDEKRYFNGHISRLSQSGNQGSFAVYQATVRPWLWFLTRTADCRVFQNKTVPDIVKEVFRDNGYTDFEEKLGSSYRTWEYCVQYRETDFNFISRLLEQEGIYYYFKHKEGKHTLILSDNYSAHEKITGYESIPYYPPDDTTVRDEEFISSWFISKQIQPGFYALNEYDFERPKTDLKVSSVIAREHSASEFEVYDYPGEYIETDDGDNYARARIEELHVHYEQAQGKSDARGIVTGGLFELSEYPREDQNREYLVVSATHEIQSDDFESSGSGGGSVYSNNFSVIDAKTPFRASRTTPKPIVQGPQTAVVVGPSGEEIYTDKYSRVKLQFHWDRYGKSDENSSCWVRVSQLWAGKTWGGIHIPRIGQEVIVEFLEGDPDQPIITGRVYNADEMPPYDLPANKTQSGIKSRSSKGGSGANFNEFRMEDKIGEEEVYIHAEKDQNNIVENDETTSVGHDRTEDVGNDETITIGNNRTEKVVNNEDIMIGNNRTEMVGVNETINIGSNRSVTIGSNKMETIAINKAETIGVAKELTIGGAYQVTVGAAMNETIGGAKAEEIGAVKSVSVGGSSSEGVGGSKSVSAGGNILESAKKDVSITAGKDVSISSAENMSIAIGDDFAIKCDKKGSIDITDELTIKCGKATIAMKKNGDIIINGKKISIKGSGDVVIKGSKILQN